MSDVEDAIYQFLTKMVDELQESYDMTIKSRNRVKEQLDLEDRQVAFVSTQLNEYRQYLEENYG